MKVTETISHMPISLPKSVRPDEIKVLTTGRAGKILPVKYIPLLREDRIARGKCTLRFEMAETLFPLMNAVNVTAFAHLIPWSAFERFEGGMDTLNRAYQGVAEPTGGAVTQFFQTNQYSSSDQIFRTMGIHMPELAYLNSGLVEAYNLLVNWRRKARSSKLPLRVMNDKTLAQAFWKNTGMSHIVPDYDAAMMDGAVNIQLQSSLLPVKGIGLLNAGVSPIESNITVKETNGTATYGTAANGVSGEVYVKMASAVGTAAPQIFAELAAQGIPMLLSNLELAQQTQRFGELRTQFEGLEEHLIDLLMEGIRVPDEALKQPILLDRKSTIFGYTERHATDGANLDVSRTTGVTELTLNFRTPPVNPGGIVLITVEIVPDQLFERRDDYYLSNYAVSGLPNAQNDYLDPEKVSIVPNRHVDALHSTPAGVFGYAPLNHQWKRSFTNIGGKFFRPAAAGFVEDRQRFWAVEQANPALATDFYLVNATLPHTVFADTLADPFEVLATGQASIIGNTIFGKPLHEDDGHYDAVAAQVDTSRIVQV